MDISRSILDNLMGRDRNLPKNSTTNRDHYSNPDVAIFPLSGLQTIFDLFLFQHFIPQHHLR